MAWGEGSEPAPGRKSTDRVLRIRGLEKVLQMSHSDDREPCIFGIMGCVLTNMLKLGQHVELEAVETLTPIWDLYRLANARIARKHRLLKEKHSGTANTRVQSNTVVCTPTHGLTL